MSDVFSARLSTLAYRAPSVFSARLSTLAYRAPSVFSARLSTLAYRAPSVPVNTTRRNNVVSTSIRHYHDVVCLLGVDHFQIP